MSKVKIKIRIKIRIKNCDLALVTKIELGPSAPAGTIAENPNGGD